MKIEDCDDCRSLSVACFLSIFSLVALWTPDVWLLPLLHAVLSYSDVGLVGSRPPICCEFWATAGCGVWGSTIEYRRF